MRKQTLLRVLVLGLGIAMAGPALSAGDPHAGRLKAFTCFGCHGIPGYTNAYPNYHVPKLGGQHAQYIVKALTEYKEHKRSYPTMQAQAASLSKQDMEDIAAFFQGFKNN